MIRMLPDGTSSEWAARTIRHNTRKKGGTNIAVPFVLRQGISRPPGLASWCAEIDSGAIVDVAAIRAVA
jgi:hypothetical protein